ncbi:hypothetical protein D908_11954 [Vibrio mimicus CAIM 602]|nr:hypothetical protein D908_11954 [Vibrio mimicus CAIM 602]
MIDLDKPIISWQFLPVNFWSYDRQVQNVRDFTHAMIDLFNTEMQYRCPFWKDPETCSCASCFNQRLLNKRCSALKAAEAKISQQQL